MGLGKAAVAVIGGAAVLVGAGVALNEAFNIASGAAAFMAEHPASIKSITAGFGASAGAALLAHEGYKWGSKKSSGHVGAGLGEGLIGILVGAILGGIGGGKLADMALDHAQPKTSGAVIETIDRAQTLAAGNAYTPSLRI